MGHILQQKIHGAVTEPQVFIKNGSLLYYDTPENFEIDYGSPFPALGVDEYMREYTTGVQHGLFDNKDRFLSSSDETWAEGEAIITALPALIAAKEAREYVAPSLEEAKATGKSEIDSMAGTVRSKYITVAPGQEMTYLEKSDQATDFVAAGYPADTSSYPFIQAEMDATGQTKEQAADGILAQKSAWITVGSAIEEHRLYGKAQVDVAVNLAEVDTAVANATALLDAV